MSGDAKICSLKKLLFSGIFLIFSNFVYASDISLFTGWWDVNSVTLSTGELEFDNFSVFGIRHEKDLFSILGLENTFSFSPGSVLTTAGENDKGIQSTSNLVLNIPVGRVLPFVTAGLGVSHKTGGSFPDVGRSFLINWGAGVKLTHLVGLLGLRMDYRRFSIRGVLDGNVSTNELSAGVMLTY